ncbi:MAG TPA: CAP domain-containing protein [Gammaproteobacteria bacterium]|nr:CAP domain-containing protein [Gammaproteobacteria bacterium]
MRRLARWLRRAAACAALLSWQAARADPAAIVNALRATGCCGVAAVGAAAQRDTTLDAAAFEMGRDAKLADALERVGYPAAKSTAFHVRGSREDDVIRDMLAERYCAPINDPLYVALGVHQRGLDTWIIMAGRTAVPFTELRDPAAVAQRVFELINAARAEARQCGRERRAAAPPLTFSTTLAAAASLHALDMARRGVLSHEGADGSSSGERITRAGLAWQASGENVAAGQPDADTVVQAWLDSPGHCATLMEPRFTQTGVAFALAPGKNPAVYWAQEFATPQ